MRLNRNTKLMLFLLVTAIASGGFDVLSHALGYHLLSTHYITLVALVILLVLHSNWQVGRGGALSFFLLAAAFGLIFEIWGLKGGTFFGGRYVYSGADFKFWGVPYIIPIYWAIFIYTAYSMSNAFWAWAGLRKPSHNGSSLAAVMPILVVDGVLTVTLDLILDPVRVRQGSWTWLSHGSYFGIPIGNFIGWFTVTVLVTATFRLYEYFRSGRLLANESLLLIPVCGYGALGVSLGVSAVIYGMYVIAVLSIFLIVVPAVANIMLFYSYRHRVRL